MTGVTIDHMISVTILVAALLLAMASFNGIFASAIAYEHNRQVTLKAVDLMETLCLSPGGPEDWGRSNATLLGFGLGDPEQGGYTISPFSTMRLRTKSGGQDSTLVYYPKTGEFYNNFELNSGGSLLLPVGDCVNYTTAAELLGVSRSYGFQIYIYPTLNVSIHQAPANNLVLEVEVRGPGLPLGGATVKYYLYQVVQGGGFVPSFLTYSGAVETDSLGKAVLEFPLIDDQDDAYSIIVYTRLGGLKGVGYYSHNVLGGYPEFIVPLVKDIDEGKIIIAHSWDVNNYTETPVPDVHYNAAFFVQSEDLELQRIEMTNSTGHLNYGEGKPYDLAQVPPSETGILLIAYRWGNRIGSVMMPFGINALGVSVEFGADYSGYTFVATELRQVLIDGVSYQVQLAVWSLKG